MGVANGAGGSVFDNVVIRQIKVMKRQQNLIIP